ncbi:hypothetical protein C2S51_033399 [Perilla frutescens var. frutescens]|nr:hypothetical protein C2S51_033399 [Perilla frutescens var. frutescens]
MAPRRLMNYIMVVTATLLLLGAVQSPQAEARKFAGVNPFCRTASYRRSCTQMVSGAANWHDASANAIKATIDLAKRLKGLVPTIEPAIAHLEPMSRDSIRESCADSFDNVVDDLQVSLQALEAGDIGTVKSYLSSSVAADCRDSLKEFGIGAEFPLNKYSDHLTQKVDNCLAVIMQE